MVNEYHCFL